jgi:predicted N-acyltransferase
MSEELRIRIVPAIADIAAPAWDGCANPTESSAASPPYNPFISHDFLAALELSGSAIARTGWQAQHLVAEANDGAIAGVVPCYLKSHSRGEYVFDAGWADAYERAGGSYYPKLQVSVPFTPATGRRLLAAPGPRADAVRRGLAAGLIELAALREASSVHVTFAPQDEWTLLGEHGYLLRNDQQFHWENGGYKTFEDFLGALAARKRKAIRRERTGALETGIEVQWLTGSDLTESVWDTFFAFYMETGSRKWGPAVSDAQVLLAHRRDAWPTGCCWCWRSAPGASSRARSTSSAATRSMAAIGARSSTTRSCTSSCATIKAIDFAIQTSLPGSRPGARASTSWRAATCR